MLTTNPAFYRSTRESAFNLVLTFAQMRRLVKVQTDNVQANEDRAKNRKLKELRVTLEAAKLYCPEPTPEEWWCETIPEFVDEGDGTSCFCTIPTNPTERALEEKGMVTGWKHRMVLTRAGYLTLQLLQVSGHVQEINWAKDKVVTIQQED